MRPITPDDLREKIIAARAAAGISQAAAARAAAISQPAWSDWERDGKPVSLDTLRRMAAAVGIDVAGPVFVADSAPKKNRKK